MPIRTEPVLPEDEWQRIFKLPTEPSRTARLSTPRPGRRLTTSKATTPADSLTPHDHQADA